MIFVIMSRIETLAKRRQPMRFRVRPRNPPEGVKAVRRIALNLINLTGRERRQIGIGRIVHITLGNLINRIIAEGVTRIDNLG